MAIVTKIPSTIDFQTRMPLMTEKKRRSEEENNRRAREIEEAKLKAEEERRRLERELGLSDDSEMPKSDEVTNEAEEPSASSDQNTGNENK